ncbi:hypothetical protein, partial [Muribaculum intestinale]|uniref:hypothetical protein n=1 Tax=Muribaculum intestinale TaxID=1796646 RepID=UPI00272C1FA0
LIKRYTTQVLTFVIKHPLNLSIQVFAIDILYERLSIVGHTKIATHLIYTHFTSRNAYINRAAAGMCCSGSVYRIVICR